MATRFAGIDDIRAFARVPLDRRLNGRDLIAFILGHAAERGDAVAVRYLPSGTADGPAEVFSRRQLVDGAAAIAKTLRDNGVTQNDVVASLLPNGPGTLAAALAGMAVGKLAPINSYLDESQIRKLLADCRARVVLLPRETPEAIAGTLSALRATSDPSFPRVVVIDTASLPADTSAPPLQARPLSDLVALFHTGGTTGLPKFVPLTAANIAAIAISSQFGYGYDPSDNVLCAMPMFHVGGLFACSLFPLLAGSAVTVLGPLGYRGKDVIARLPDTVAAGDISVVIGPPTVMAQVAANPPEPARAPHLRLFINGAAALPRSVGLRLSERTGMPVVEPWGLTESTLAVTCGPRDGAIRQGSVGLALPYSEVKAVHVDAAGVAIRDCAADEIGVLAIRGPMVFDGYLDRPPELQPFFADGWLDTGDLGRIDADGFVWVTGRAKELIKRGGHGIDPGMIEDAFTVHPAVALAVAIGKPDAYAGELPVAYVQLRPGAEVSADALLEFARERIPERAAVPKEIVFLPALPLTAIGKVHKQTLKFDATRRVAEEVVRAIAGAAGAVEVAPHPLHGLEVRARVPARHADAVRDRLAGFAFRSETIADDQGAG